MTLPSPKHAISIREPDAGAYRELIWVAFELCDWCSLVVRNDGGLRLESAGKKVLESIQPWQIREFKGREWPGTKLLQGDGARISCYKTSAELRQIFLESAQSLYDWKQPKLPEDPAFYVGDEVWLFSTTHEKESYLSLAEEQMLAILAKYPSMRSLI